MDSYNPDELRDEPERDSHQATTERTPNPLGELPQSDESDPASTHGVRLPSPERITQAPGSPPAKGWVILGTGQELQLAKPSARLAARAIDSVILVILIIGGFVLVVVAAEDLANWSNWLSLATGFIVVLIAHLYEIALVALKGQTVGKMVTKIRVARLDNGGLPSWIRSICRSALPGTLGAVSYRLPSSFYYIGTLLVLLCYVSLTWHRYRRGWHDMIAGTIVVNTHRGMMDRYNHEERQSDQGGHDRGESEPAGAPREFPWQESAGTDQSPPVWEEQPATTAAADVGTQAAARAGSGPAPGNGMAVAGFVLSLMSLVLSLAPVLNIIPWILAVTFSWLGVSRANDQGRPHRGLAIAGLSVSLVSLVLSIVWIVWIRS